MSNYNKVKEICNDILKKASNKYNIDINAYIVGSIEFYKTDFYKNNLKLCNSIIDKIVLSTIPYNTVGLYESRDKSLVIYIHKYKFMPSNNITKVLFVLYHELFHSIQNKELDNKDYNWNNYYDFICQLERFAKKNIYSEIRRYDKEHDSFMFETLADIFGMINTKKYLEQNNIKPDNRFIDKIDDNINNRMNDYDQTYLIDIIIKEYKFIKNNRDFKTHNFDIFLTKEGVPKDKEEILKDKRINKIDKTIVEAFFNSKSFNKKPNIRSR